MFRIFSFLGLAAVMLQSCEYNAIKWYSSTGSKQWEEQRNPLIYKVDSLSNADVEVFPDSIQQPIQGFGGCFNEAGWDALNLLDVKSRKKVFQMLFTDKNGLDFNICRMPIGANDYSRNYYSYNDDSTDLSMQHFSIAHDTSALIPYIKEAMSYKPELKVWASPWTPPAWMKTNNHYACWSGANNMLDPALNGKEGVNQIKTDSVILKAYALYLSKFVQAYQSEGIDLYAIHVQNEFNSCQVFPSCVWSAQTLGLFIGSYLGPKFDEQKVNAQIWVGTIERSNIALIDTIYASQNASKYIKGLGFQWAGKDAIPVAKVKYPNLQLMQTETECGDGSNNWAAAEYTFGLMKHYFENGANAYMYWNMILTDDGLSKWGWKQNALFSVNPVTKKLTINPEFYLFQHFCFNIKQGAFKVKVSDKNNQTLAFKNKNNNLVVIISNINDTASNLKIKVHKRYFRVKVEPHSFNTFLLK